MKGWAIALIVISCIIALIAAFILYRQISKRLKPKNNPPTTKPDPTLQNPSSGDPNAFPMFIDKDSPKYEEYAKKFVVSLGSSKKFDIGKCLTLYLRAADITESLKHNTDRKHIPDAVENLANLSGRPCGEILATYSAFTTSSGNYKYKPHNTDKEIHIGSGISEIREVFLKAYVPEESHYAFSLLPQYLQSTLLGLVQLIDFTFLEAAMQKHLKCEVLDYHNNIKLKDKHIKALYKANSLGVRIIDYLKDNVDWTHTTASSSRENRAYWEQLLYIFFSKHPLVKLCYADVIPKPDISKLPANLKKITEEKQNKHTEIKPLETVADVKDMLLTASLLNSNSSVSELKKYEQYKQDLLEHIAYINGYKKDWDERQLNGNEQIQDIFRYGTNCLTMWQEDRKAGYLNFITGKAIGNPSYKELFTDNHIGLPLRYKLSEWLFSDSKALKENKNRLFNLLSYNRKSTTIDPAGVASDHLLMNDRYNSPLINDRESHDSFKSSEVLNKDQVTLVDLFLTPHQSNDFPADSFRYERGSLYSSDSFKNKYKHYGDNRTLYNSFINKILSTIYPIIGIAHSLLIGIKLEAEAAANNHTFPEDFHLIKFVRLVLGNKNDTTPRVKLHLLMALLMDAIQTIDYKSLYEEIKHSAKNDEKVKDFLKGFSFLHKDDEMNVDTEEERKKELKFLTQYTATTLLSVINNDIKNTVDKVYNDPCYVTQDRVPHLAIPLNAKYYDVTGYGRDTIEVKTTPNESKRLGVGTPSIGCLSSKAEKAINFACFFLTEGTIIDSETTASDPYQTKKLGPDKIPLTPKLLKNKGSYIVFTEWLDKICTQLKTNGKEINMHSLTEMFCKIFKSDNLKSICSSLIKLTKEQNTGGHYKLKDNFVFSADETFVANLKKIISISSNSKHIQRILSSSAVSGGEAGLGTIGVMLQHQFDYINDLDKKAILKDTQTKYDQIDKTKLDELTHKLMVNMMFGMCEGLSFALYKAKDEKIPCIDKTIGELGIMNLPNKIFEKFSEHCKNSSKGLNDEYQKLSSDVNQEEAINKWKCDFPKRINEKSIGENLTSTAPEESNKYIDLAGMKFIDDGLGNELTKLPHPECPITWHSNEKSLETINEETINIKFKEVPKEEEKKDKPPEFNLTFSFGNCGKDKGK